MLKDLKNSSDADLIELVKNGNSVAFEILMNRYRRKVANTVFGMLGKCTEAEDVGQETFIRFYQSLNTFRGDSSVGTYLTRIAINLSINEINKRKRSLFSSFFRNDEQTEEIYIPDESENQEDAEIKEVVNLALLKLDVGIRSVVVLRMIDGYSVKETSDILNIPQGTVLSRLSRGQEKLKVILKKYIE